MRAVTTVRYLIARSARYLPQMPQSGRWRVAIFELDFVAQQSVSGLRNASRTRPPAHSRNWPEIAALTPISAGLAPVPALFAAH